MFNNFKFILNYIMFCSTLIASDHSSIPVNTSYDRDTLYNEQEQNVAALFANLQQASNKSPASVRNQYEYDLDDEVKTLSCQSIDTLEFLNNASNKSSTSSKILDNNINKEDIDVKTDKIITLRINRIIVTKKILVPIKKLNKTNNNILSQNNKHNNTMGNNVIISTNMRNENNNTIPININETNNKIIDPIINNKDENKININVKDKNINTIQTNMKDKSNNKLNAKKKKSRLKDIKKLHDSFEKLQIVKNCTQVILGSKMTSNSKIK